MLLGARNTIAIAACALTILLAGCHAKKAPTCSQQVTELRDWMMLMVQIESDPFLDESVELVQRKGPAPLGHGPLILVASSELFVGDYKLTSLARDDVTSEFKNALEHENISTPNPEFAYLAINPEAPWHNVVLALNGVSDAGIGEVRFLFEDSQVANGPFPAPPGPSAIDGRLQKVEGGDDLIAILSELADPCEPLVEALTYFYQAPLSESESIPKAVAACNCNVDVAGLRAVLWYNSTARNRKKHYTYLARRLGAEMSASSFIEAPQTPWSDVVERIDETKADLPLHFTLQAPPPPPPVVPEPPPSAE